MKRWYLSKTLWVNALAGLAGILQAVTGNAWIDAEAQVGILAMINVILRIITKESLG